MKHIEEQRMMILLVIRDGSTSEKWLSAKEISERSGIPLKIVSARLKSLSKDGRIYHSVHKKRGSTGYKVKYYRWQLIPAVRVALSENVD